MNKEVKEAIRRDKRARANMLAENATELKNGYLGGIVANTPNQYSSLIYACKITRMFDYYMESVFFSKNPVCSSRMIMRVKQCNAWPNAAVAKVSFIR